MGQQFQYFSKLRDQCLEQWFLTGGQTHPGGRKKICRWARALTCSTT